MNSAPTFVVDVDDQKASATEVSITQNELLPLIEPPEISRDAWKVIIFLTIGAALFLTSVGAYVLSAVHRFQDCL